MFEVAYLLPTIKRRLPEARLPMESPGMGAALAGSARARPGDPPHPAASRDDRGRHGRRGAVPAMMALRGSRIAGYHGAEHKAIGGYEQDGAPVDIAKEHERCGSHMVGPLLIASTAAATCSSRACPPRAAARPGWWRASRRWAPPPRRSRG